MAVAGGDRRLMGSAGVPYVRRIVDGLMSIGAYPGESVNQKARSRIMVGSIWLISALSVSSIVADFEAGFVWVGWGGMAILAFTAL